jgi:malto-oligosyltrehalose trehalohydrolase
MPWRLRYTAAPERDRDSGSILGRGPALTTRRRYVKSFGSELRDDGRVRFRLWAPEAARVDLSLESATDSEPVPGLVPMHREADGWYGLTTDRAGAGSRYRYRIDGQLSVPDPASRFQPADVHGPSEVIDAAAWAWPDPDWRGRPWEETIFYELHVGTMTPAGTFSGVADRLDELADLGVTALQLMPVADFPGSRNWGYDGVLPFAPDSRYGRPEDLKSLVAAAHRCGLMVFLDVVYNHFGPDGDYLRHYAPAFFAEGRQTLWGAAIDFSQRTVREFFIQNALYWLEEYHLDGLRLDAVNHIHDDSPLHVLCELAERVHAGPGRGRHVHLVLENGANQSRFLRRGAAPGPRHYVAQWNDDVHHVLHTLLTGEDHGYYRDYADRPTTHLARCLTEGFAYQGERSAYWDCARGEPSADLPTTAFVAFLQNHDQIGNRALGERLTELVAPDRLAAATALLLLAPSPPLLFMGQEWGCTQPFLFFCDFPPPLAQAVARGRRREFAGFRGFSDPSAAGHIPDPNDQATFERSRLDWRQARAPEHRAWREFHTDLLRIRRTSVIPVMDKLSTGARTCRQIGAGALLARWAAEFGPALTVAVNLGSRPSETVEAPAGTLIYQRGQLQVDSAGGCVLPPASIGWWLDER